MKKAFSFIAGTTIAAIIIYTIYFIVVISTFSLRGRTLAEEENELILFLSICIVTTAIGGYITYRYLKNHKTFTAAGIGVVMLIPVSLTVHFIIVVATTFHQRQTFDANQWQLAEYKPFLMAKDLIRSDDLEGKSKEEVITILSEPDRETVHKNETETIVYDTDSISWMLEVKFENGYVKKTQLYHPGLGV